MKSLTDAAFHIAGLLAAGLPALAQYTGQITGVVSLTNGKAAHSAKVYATLTSNPPLKMDHTLTPRVVVGRVVKDGTFTISNVPPGEYRICVESVEQAYVNTCRWGQGPMATVTDGRVAAVATVRMIPGVKLRVRVADPTGALRSNGGKGFPLLVGLQLPDGMLSLPVVGSDAAGRDHEMLVPFDTDLRVAFIGRAYNLAAVAAIAGTSAPLTGSTATGTASTPVRIPAGTTPAPLTITIAGLSGLK